MPTLSETLKAAIPSDAPILQPARKTITSDNVAGGNTQVIAYPIQQIVLNALAGGQHEPKPQLAREAVAILAGMAKDAGKPIPSQALLQKYGEGGRDAALARARIQGELGLTTELRTALDAVLNYRTPAHNDKAAIVAKPTLKKPPVKKKIPAPRAAPPAKRKWPTLSESEAMAPDPQPAPTADKSFASWVTPPVSKVTPEMLVELGAITPEGALIASDDFMIQRGRRFLLGVMNLEIVATAEQVEAAIDRLRAASEPSRPTGMAR